MKHWTLRILAVLVAFFAMAASLPWTAFASGIEMQAEAAGTQTGAGNISKKDTPEYLEMSDGYISVKVSTKNGGFYVGTAEGDVIIKSDNDKDLMYNDESFDTSFTSFRVTKNGKTTDYIFGRDYSYMGVETSDVHLYRSADNTIVAEWQVDGILLKQIIALMGTDSYQHGMAYVSYSAVNTTSTPIENIEARVLVDTALGNIDYAYYMLGQNDGSYIPVEQEKTFSGSDYSNYFFAYDNKTSPAVTAYTLNDTARGDLGIPEKVTFAHWMDLASTMFDYTPSVNDPTNFTEVLSSQDKLTADSAFALYYDMGGIEAQASGSTEGNTISFYYGVYSNYKAGQSDVAVNFTAAGTMFLDEERESTYRDLNGSLPGNFSTTIKLSNIVDTTFSNISVAVYHEDAIKLHNGSSFITSTPSSPYFMTVTDLKPGETRDVRIDFQLDPTMVTSYRRVRIVLYNATGSEGFTDDNRIVEKELFILCPGDESAEVTFTGMNPESVFTSGKRFAYITGSNFSMIRDTTQYRIVLRPLDGGEDVVLDMDKVVVNPDPNQNTVTLVLDMELRPTTYSVILDWHDTSMDDMTSDTLELIVTDVPSPGDPGYVSSGVYGVVTIERHGKSYDVVNYESEEAYRNTDTAPEDIMLVLRGDFNVLSTEGKNNFKAEAITLMPGEVITINDCMEVKEGRVTVTKVYDDDGRQTSIDVDIDGKVYTAVANTKIWDGVLAITSFDEGTLYTLPVYSEDGELSYREGEETAETVTLLWPGAASVTQTIVGLLLNFRYGEFALMEQGDSVERVISFGAALDPSILVPPGMVGTKAHYSNLEKAQREMGVSNYSAAQLRATDTQYRQDQAAWRDDQLGTLNLYMDDILFGKGGFIGFNTQIEVGIPAYTEPLPYIEGTLSLKVINDYWAFGVDGAADMMVFEMEATLSFKSYKGIPVLDEFYFFIGGVEPGLPVDPFGVFWVKGAGAGIGEIYETFFGSQRIPPLTLMISGEFALFSQISARADLKISAQGFEGYINSMKVAGITIIDRLGGSVYWYPNLSISFAVRVDILDCIIGEGGILLEENDDGSIYFCGYAKATVKIPDSIWFIGGTEIGSASIGIDTKKVWGSVRVIGIGVGIRYYWGGDVDVDLGKTYDVPSPLSASAFYAPIPVYTDAATGQTLYMQLENRVKLLSDTSAGLEYTQIQTSPDGRTHSFLLDETVNEDALTVLTFPASNLFMAQDIKNSIKVYLDGDTTQAYGLEWFDNQLGADHELNRGTNALFRYDETTKTATVSISITDPAYYGRPISVTADSQSTLEIFGIGRVTTLDEVILNESMTEATVAGTELQRLSVIRIYAEDSQGSPYLLAEMKPAENSTFNETTVSVPVTLPSNLPTGDYTLRAAGVVVNEQGEEIENPMAESAFTYVNPLQPAAPSGVTLTLSGDFTVTADVTTDDIDRDGYLTTIYEKTADGLVATMFADTVNQLEDGAKSATQTALLLGGRYLTLGENGTEIEQGLEAGKNYVVAVQSYRTMEDGSRLLSEPALSNEVTMILPTRVEPSFTLEGEGAQTVTGVEFGDTDVSIDTINQSNFTVAIEAVGFGGGEYRINDGEYQPWNGRSITFENMEDGFYTLHLRGTSATHDAFTAVYQFSVDTLAPSILVSSHQGGGFFTGSSVTLEGFAEAYATLDIYVEGDLVATDYVDGEGSFSVEVPLDESMSYQRVVLLATDRAGNVSMPYACNLTNSILGNPDLEAVILFNGRETTRVVVDGGERQLTFAYKLDDRYVLINDGTTASAKITWNADIIEGRATITPDGVLKGEGGARGIVMASLEGKTAVAELIVIDLALADMLLDIPEEGYTYDGTPKTPDVRLYGMDETIVEGVDYDISYVNNVNAGMASAIITPTDSGRCVGTRIINFEIKARSFEDEDFAFTISEDGSENPAVTLVYAGTTLVKDQDYILTYTVNTDGTQVIITVEGIGNYTGMCSEWRQISPDDPGNPDGPVNPDDPTNPDDPMNPGEPAGGCGSGGCGSGGCGGGCSSSVGGIVLVLSSICAFALRKKDD